jgi:hypothetical protein
MALNKTKQEYIYKAGMLIPQGLIAITLRANYKCTHRG